MNGKTQHHRAIAPGVIAVTMFVLLVVNCNLKVSSAVLPRSDTWNIGITTRDLGGFTPKTTTRKYEEELYWASLSTELTADDQTQATGNYPQMIRQAVTFTRSPELAERVAQSSTSAGVSCVMCTASRSGPTRPSASSRASGRRPCLACDSATSLAVSCTWQCTRVSSSAARVAMRAKLASLTE